MKWPWQKGRQPMQATLPAVETPPDIGTDETTEALRRAREAAKAAREAFVRAHARRPAVTATGEALKQTNKKNHFAELVHQALGSGR